MTYHFYNEYHLGDCFPQLHFMRKLAEKYPDHSFAFYCHHCYFTELNPLIEDVFNVTINDISIRPIEAQNCWKNWQNIWERSRLRYVWGPFHVEWFRYLAREMGLESPIQSVEDLLFDCPSIQAALPCPLKVPETTVLINNAQPCSGQFRAYNSLSYLDPLIEAISKKHKVMTTQKSDVGVPCTRDYRMNCANIGKYSMSVDYFVGICNGPLWLCLNKWNAERMKAWVYLRDNGEQIAVTKNELYATNLENALRVCREIGIA